jgi:hypothetical protein
LAKKLTYEFVKSSFESEGYILLSKEYRNSKQKLNYICPKGHRHSICWDNWKQGQRCFYCVGKVKPTFSLVKHSFVSEGYVLLSKVYKNNYTKLDYKCPNGHEHSITWNNWKAGWRCPYCAGNSKLTLEYVREQFEKEGYKELPRKPLQACLGDELVK